MIIAFYRVIDIIHVLKVIPLITRDCQTMFCEEISILEEFCGFIFSPMDVAIYIVLNKTFKEVVPIIHTDYHTERHHSVDWSDYQS